MKLNNMSKEELELYSYEDLTKMILEEKGKPENTQVIFKQICELLGLSDNAYADKIGDYYTALTTDKDFVLLDDGKWDLRDHHPVSTILSEEIEEEEDEEEETSNDDEPVEDNLEDDSLDDLDENDIDEAIEEDDLTIIDEEELED